ncbi:hypothetical protein ACW0JT_08535 [Arthrobacter sp. SA17]
MNKRISIAVAIALAGGLSSCAYSSGDGPTISGSPGQHSDSAPASGESNMDALRRVLGPADPTGLPYETSQEATLEAEIGPGQYLLTAACVASPGADVSVTFGDSSPEVYSFSCGMGKVIQVDHTSGKILAKVVPQEPLAGTVTGLKLEHHPAPRDMAARNQAWMAEQLGPEKPGEFRRFLSSGEGTATGPLASAGTYDLAFVCSGPGAVDLLAMNPNGDPIAELPDVPCGPVFRTNFQLNADGVHILVDSDSDGLRAAVSVLPGHKAGS